MLAYVIIAIELVILYTVFWYVFLREPKPYRIKSNAWGSYHGPKPSPSVHDFARGYNNAHGDNCNCTADQERKKRNAIQQEWNAPDDGTPLTPGDLIRSQARGVERVTKDSIKKPEDITKMQYSQERPQAPAYFPHNPAEQYRQRQNTNTVPGFLAQLGDTLNRINVKLP